MESRDLKLEVWHSPAEVAERASVRVKTVYGWMQKGLLPFSKLGVGRGARVRIKESDLLSFMDARRRAAFAQEDKA